MKQGQTHVFWSIWSALDKSALPQTKRTKTNPTTIACAVLDPTGATTNPTPVLSSVGVYYVEVLLAHVGTYTLTWTGTGAAAGVVRHTVTVAAL